MLMLLLLLQVKGRRGTGGRVQAGEQTAESLVSRDAVRGTGRAVDANQVTGWERHSYNNRIKKAEGLEYFINRST
jgi:hypothetical protein